MPASLPDSIVRALSDAVEADRDAMRDLLAALVAIPTAAAVSPVVAR
jgi:hypothetical protein